MAPAAPQNAIKLIEFGISCFQAGNLIGILSSFAPICVIQIRAIPVVFYDFCFTFELNCADALQGRKVFS
jgi:hypothetical protein